MYLYVCQHVLVHLLCLSASFCLCLCMSSCLCVCLCTFVCPSVCLIVCLHMYVHVCVSVCMLMCVCHVSDPITLYAVKDPKARVFVFDAIAMQSWVYCFEAYRYPLGVGHSLSNQFNMASYWVITFRTLVWLMVRFSRVHTCRSEQHNTRAQIQIHQSDQTLLVALFTLASYHQKLDPHWNYGEWPYLKKIKERKSSSVL